MEQPPAKSFIEPIQDTMFFVNHKGALALQYRLMWSGAPEVSAPIVSWDSSGRIVHTATGKTYLLHGTLRYFNGRKQCKIPASDSVNLEHIKTIVMTAHELPPVVADEVVVLAIMGEMRLQQHTRRHPTKITAPVAGWYGHNNRTVLLVDDKRYQLVGEVKYFNELGDTVVVAANEAIPFESIALLYKILFETS